MSDQRRAEHMPQASRWWLAVAGILAGVGLGLLSPLVAWGYWYGSSNDGEGSGASTALAIGILCPLALGVVVTLVRSWRQVGVGLLVGAIAADVGAGWLLAFLD